MKTKNICCIGAGYVGGPTMAVFADKCTHLNIYVVDNNKERIDAWNSEDLDLPIFEPGLKEVVKRTRNRNLFFTTDINSAIQKSEMIFISVNTPTKTYGRGAGMASDLKFVELCARRIAEVANNDKIVVEKSTLPVKTAALIKNILHGSGRQFNFQILSNPEFLAEGTAINDLVNPDRVLIGGDIHTTLGQEAINELKSVYSQWVPEEKILTTNTWSSELTKLAANAFLAQRVSSINSLVHICEKTGADIQELSRSIGADTRIGSKFLNASPGFGGSCFQKDILNLVYIAQSLGLEEVAEYWHQVVKMNNYHRSRITDNLITILNNTLSDKKITILGWAFKKDTNDSRESSAIYIADQLLKERARVRIYDPMVSTERIYSDIAELNSTGVYVTDDVYDAISDSYAVIVLTEWDEFKYLDWNRISNIMKKPAVVLDTRFVISENVDAFGIKLYTLGKPKTL